MKNRKHCSKLKDVKPFKTNLTLTRHYIMQEDDSSTVEEGFTINSPKEVLFSNNRGTKLTSKEYDDDGWFITEEDVVDRILQECGEDSVAVNGIRCALEQLKKTREKLEGIYGEVEELLSTGILTDECDLAKTLKNFKP